MRRLAQTRWWIITCLEILAISIGIFFGLHDILVASDQTKLSFVIAALWAVSTIFIGRCHFYRDSGYIRDSAKIGWFLAETCLALGMLGTVMGFLLMLGTAFAGIDVANISSVQSALNQMAVGMSTALWTTFMGLAASLFIKVQLVNLEHLADRNGQQ
jgi:hypothetical protein